MRAREHIPTRQSFGAPSLPRLSQGRIALVGGGTDEIGKAIADCLARQGIRGASNVHATSAVPSAPEIRGALRHFGLVPTSDIAPGSRKSWSALITTNPR